MHSENLSRYFVENFTGSHFEFLTEGGDKTSVKNQIVADDILAAAFLGVNFPALAILELLEGSASTLVSEQLRLIPTDQDLHAFSSNPIAPGTPAWIAWGLIDELDKVGRTKTSKLLARKRPRFLPILDDVVVCALNLGNKTAWQEVFELMTENDHSVVTELLAIQAIGAPNHSRISQISLLRVLDIVVWMEHQQDHRKPHTSSSVFTPR